MKKVKARYCKFCGSLIDNETKICGGCGKKYFKIKFKKIFFKTILFVLLILNIVLGVFCFDLLIFVFTFGTFSKIQEQCATHLGIKLF